MIGPTCPDCGTVHGSDAARAVGLFGPTLRYRPASGGPLRATRAEAEADECKARRERR